MAATSGPAKPTQRNGGGFISGIRTRFNRTGTRTRSTPTPPPAQQPPSTPQQTAQTPSSQDLSRFNQQAGLQQEAAVSGLGAIAAQAAAAQQGTTTQAAAQAAHPSMQRLSGDQWQGMTGQVNNAQRAQGASASGEVWVTVPVDRVVVSPSGAHAIEPVYSTTQGYRPKPGESAGSIPPPMAVGR